MKKILIVPMALAAVILFGSLNSSARINLANNTNKGLIQYNVKIHPNYALLVNTCPVMVAMTDKSGNILGSPQAYHIKVNTYYFYEMGPVYSTRTAILINAPGGHQQACTLVDLRNSQTGWFVGNSTYNFDLWATAREIQSPDNSTVSD